MSHNSPRSLRTKQEARTRPDVIWYEAGEKRQHSVTPTEPQVVHSSGSELARLIAESDAHLAAMRKIVR